MSATDAREAFSGRWALVLATLGMAVGTGNIWRFPRVVATNDGGSFLLAWVVFLLAWSVPLMIVEFAFGKRSRRGTIGAFATLAGGKSAWMGAWVALTATAIMFYYAVVAGWCLRYFFAAATGELGAADPAALWDGLAGSGTAVWMQAATLALCFAVVWFGVRGIERVSLVVMPILLLLVVVLAVRAVTLPGAERGLEFLFTPSWAALAQPKVWLEALTQNAWDTGAGWGLILTYAIYMRQREDVPLNAFLIGFGNNSVSLLSGIMVLCTVFALNPGAQQEIVGAGNEGLTFVWMPQLFALMPGGAFFQVLFFLALFFAASTSLISMLELATRVLIDFGLPRRRALVAVTVIGFALGVPSALSMDFFRNQDWVWSLGLMLSGLLFAVAAIKHGIDRLRREVVNGPGVDLRVGRWWTWAIAVLVPAEAVVLLAWWLRQAAAGDPAEVWAPWSTFNVGTVVVQWGIALALLLAANRWLARRSLTGAPGEQPEPTTAGQPGMLP